MGFLLKCTLYLHLKHVILKINEVNSLIFTQEKTLEDVRLTVTNMDSSLA